MTDSAGASNVSIPAGDGAGNGSGISIGSEGRIEQISGTDEKELSTVAKRFLVAEINRLVEENQQLKQFKDKYHDADKRLAVLKETHKPFRANEFLSSVCLMAGSAGLGTAPSFLSLNSYGWYIFFGVSAALLIAGIVAKIGGPASSATARQLKT